MYNFCSNSLHSAVGCYNLNSSHSLRCLALTFHFVCETEEVPSFLSLLSLLLHQASVTICTNCHCGIHILHEDFKLPFKHPNVLSHF